MLMKKQTKKAKSSARSKAKNTATRKVSAKNQSDIIELILADHKPLKKLLKILKDSDIEKSQKKVAFDEFAPLLLSHAEPEEQSLYAQMKDNDELRSESFEGITEHQLATQMIADAKACDDDDEWMAKVKVLAELVEHHIKEEEEDMLPDVRKQMDIEMRVQIGEQYMQLRQDFEMPDFDENKSSNRKSKHHKEVHLY